MSVAAEGVPQEKELARVAEVQPPKVGGETGPNARAPENDCGGVGSTRTRPEDHATFSGVPLAGKYIDIDVDDVKVSPSGGSGSTRKVLEAEKLCLRDGPAVACAQCHRNSVRNDMDFR